jgi:hypothetical protein
MCGLLESGVKASSGWRLWCPRLRADAHGAPAEVVVDAKAGW